MDSGKKERELVDLLIVAALDILKLENRVSELETQFKVPAEKRYNVRGR